MPLPHAVEIQGNSMGRRLPLLVFPTPADDIIGARDWPSCVAYADSWLAYAPPHQPQVWVCRELALQGPSWWAGGEDSRSGLRMLPFDSDLMAVAAWPVVPLISAYRPMSMQ